MSKVKDKPATTALVWKESIAINGYRCPECRRLLYRKESNELMTSHLNFVKRGDRHYGACLCGNPAVIAVDDYEGPPKSENWEEHLNRIHEEEMEKLRKAFNSMKSERNRLQNDVKQLNVVIKLRGDRITELTDKCNKLIEDLDASQVVIAKLKGKTAALEAQLERLQRREG